jgi:hypothetical protein
MDSASLVTATLAVLVGILAAVAWDGRYRDAFGGPGGGVFAGPGGAVVTGGLFNGAGRPNCTGVSPGLLYSTTDIDPLITGQLFADRPRHEYASRVGRGYGTNYGLSEFSSSGLPGQVGVSVGPLEMADEVGRDDGIPETWDMPSTPIQFYRPRRRDYFGVEGPTPYTEGLLPLSEPDHDPLMP